MEPRDKELLKQTFELAKENNKMLRSIRSSGRWGLFLKIIYWAILIGGAIGLYYYLEPFLKDLFEIYNQVVNFKNSVLPQR